MKRFLLSLILLAGVSFAADTPVYRLRLDGDANGANNAFTNLNTVVSITGSFDRVEYPTGVFSRVEAGTGVFSSVSMGISKFVPPRWVDEKYSGLAISAGVTAPQLTLVYPGSDIYGMGFDTTDFGYFNLQWQHGTTDTNSVFPNFYYTPHIHISAPTLTPPATNVTFIIHYRISRIGSTFVDTDVYRTNTIGFVSASAPVILSFNHVTNNSLSGADSVIIQGKLSRIPSAVDGYGTARVIVDSIDFHIPIDAIGSMNEIGGDQ